MTPLVVRMVLSLCIVLGLLLLAARIAGKRYKNDPGSAVTVLQRQALSRSSTVTVVSVGNRVLVLGTTEQQVRVLAELEPGEIGATGAAGGAAGGAGAAPGTLYAVPADDAPSLDAVAAPADFAQALLAAQEQAPAAPARSQAGRHRAAAPVERGHVGQPGQPHQGALAGSVLSLGTWRQALGALTGRAS